MNEQVRDWKSGWNAFTLLGMTVLLTGTCTAHAFASDFTAFAEDENVCRSAGAKAIDGASGPSAAHRYDLVYGRCMVAHGRRRQVDSMQQDGGYAAGGPGSFAYPDAFYSIPYATPGYGYDGFSY